MPGTYPHSATDLALAPVLINIERNLSYLRRSEDLEYELALQLNDDSGWYKDPPARARRLQQVATRGVNQHGWQVRPTRDLQGLEVSHGTYRFSVMFGQRLADYVSSGRTVRHPAA